MNGVLAVVKRAMGGAVDLVAAAEAEIAARRSEAEARRREADELGQAWLHAQSQSVAEELARRRTEALRLLQRAETALPELEQRLAAGKAERQRGALARHRAAIAALYPKLRRAIEEAARIQAEAIGLREAAVAELGEHGCKDIPYLAFRGLLLPDLVNVWANEQERVWAAPPQSIATVATAPAAKRNSRAAATAAAQRIEPVLPAPKPARPPRRDAAPGESQTAVVFLRPGTELPDGSVAAVGDRVNLPDQARQLVLQGAADYAPAVEAANP
jgi:hypothetical protein